MSKKTIIKGTLILTIAGLITKLLGFYNRIFLTRLIGVKELGVYQLIFPVYILAFSFCCQGIATTLTKQVSYYIGKKEQQNSKKLFKYALITSFLLSIAACFIINIFADGISLHLLKNSDCGSLLKIISIAIPFVSIKACINSYFVGTNRPEFHGISHLLEQVVRISVAYFLGSFWLAKRADAKLAVIAVISGEIFATGLAVIFYFINSYKASHTKNKATSSLKLSNKNMENITTLSPLSDDRKIYKHFLQDALPITSTNIILTMFSSLEAIMLPAMLFKYYQNSDIALEIYGIVTGIVIPFLLFPSTITSSLSTMLLPAVSYANAQKNSRTIKKAISGSLFFCFLLGVITCFGYLLLGQWACEFAFESSAAGVILRKMCFLCPFIYMTGSMSAMLNGIDKAFHNMMFNVLSIAVRIIFTLTLVPIYGITAYIIGMTVSYLVLFIAMVLTLIRGL